MVNLYIKVIKMKFYKTFCLKRKKNNVYNDKIQYYKESCKNKNFNLKIQKKKTCSFFLVHHIIA